MTQNPEPKAPQSEPKPASGTPLALAGMRILLVEDTEINRRLAELILKGLGCTVTSAVNGQDALGKILKDRFDAVLMDCQMPVLDGYEATAMIRQWEQSTKAPRVTIIAMTAHSAGGNRELCLAYGMDDYLAKPYTWAGLGDMLGQYYNRDAGFM